MTPIVVVARGSRDPRHTAAVREIVGAVATARPGQRVRAAFLRHEVPDLRAALAKEAALDHRGVTVVPLLLCDGEHARLIEPELARAAARTDLGLSVRLTPTLAPSDAGSDRLALDLLVAALRRRLGEAMPGRRADALVVVSAASRVTRARQTVATVASALAAATRIPCRPAHVSSVDSTVEHAVADLRNRGARDIAAVSLQLAPGWLVDRLYARARGCGVMTVTAPLGATPELVQLVLHRAS